MKSASKIPFKSKKTPYNLNEVDVNLLLKNPSSIRKIVKGNKEEHYHDDDEEEEEEDENEDDKLDKHMKRYISEYFDNKYKKESDQRKKVKDRLEILNMFNPLPNGTHSKMYRDKYEKYHKEQKENPTKNFIRKGIDKLTNK